MAAPPCASTSRANSATRPGTTPISSSSRSLSATARRNPAPSSFSSASCIRPVTPSKSSQIRAPSPQFRATADTASPVVVSGFPVLTSHIGCLGSGNSSLSPHWNRTHPPCMLTNVSSPLAFPCCMFSTSRLYL